MVASAAKTESLEDLLQRLSAKRCPFASPFLVVVEPAKLLWCPSYGTGSRAIYRAILRATKHTQFMDQPCDEVECPGSPLRILNTSWHLRETICEAHSEFFSFAVVKNPFDLVWEVFHNTILPETPCRSPRICAAQRAIRAANNLDAAAPLEFKHFVRLIKAQKPKEMDPMWMPMSWKCRVTGPFHFPYNLVSRVEREPLGETMRWVLGQVGLPSASFHDDEVPDEVRAANHTTRHQIMQGRALRRERYRCSSCSNLFELRNIVTKVYHNDLVRYYFTNFR